MRTVIKPIPVDPQDYLEYSASNVNHNLNDYDADAGLGYASVVLFDLPKGLRTADELAEAIATAIDGGDCALVVQAYGPALDEGVLDAITQGYVDCAAWCGVYDEQGGTVEVSADDFTQDAWDNCATDVRDFVQGAPGDVRAYLEHRSATDLGHDFFLTRNGHGAGFWDRGLGALGTRLSDSARPYGETHFWLRSDGRVELG